MQIIFYSLGQIQKDTATWQEIYFGAYNIVNHILIFIAGYWAKSTLDRHRWFDILWRP